MAINNGDQTFHVFDLTSGFAQYSSQPGAPVVVGDFNGDCYDDLLTNGGTDWGGFLIAFGRGDAGFNLAFWSSDLAYAASQPGAHLIAGDFDGDGHTDLTVVAPGMTNVPVAFSYGAANFSNATTSETTFKQYSSGNAQETYLSWLSGTYK